MTHEMVKVAHATLELLAYQPQWFNKLFQIFDLLRERDATIFDKLNPVEVDYSTADLSISSEMRDKIHGEVQVNRIT